MLFYMLICLTVKDVISVGLEGKGFIRGRTKQLIGSRNFRSQNQALGQEGAGKSGGNAPRWLQKAA